MKLSLAVVAAVMFALNAQAASFVGLNASRAIAISDDGSTVVGTSGGPAFRWTQSGGLQSLGDLPGGSVSSVAQGVSADGSIIVGNGTTGPGGQREAFRWSEADGMVSIGAPLSFAMGVSADGTTIVGHHSSTNGDSAFRWDAVNGIQDLGNLPGQSAHQSRAYAISADGSTIVGDAMGQPFRWDAATGMQELAGLYDHGYHSASETDARVTSADGSVIVGIEWSDALTLSSFRWTADGGGEPIAYDYPVSFVALFDISADGSTIVGMSHEGALIWRAETGFLPLQALLTSLGIDLSGWELKEVVGVSADGMTITGNGTNPSGEMEAFIAVIPEPTTALLLALGLVGLAAGRRAN